MIQTASFSPDAVYYATYIESTDSFFLSDEAELPKGTPDALRSHTWPPTEFTKSRPTPLLPMEWLVLHECASVTTLERFLFISPVFARKRQIAVRQRVVIV